MATQGPVLEVKSLKKSFGSLRAVNELSFAVNAGESVGLLGPNGAGKTTVIAMIMGNLDPDSGTVNIAGAPLAGDCDPRKRLLGLVPQDLALYEELTARENLRFFGALHGLKRDDLKNRMNAVLEVAGLQDRSEERAKVYSGGMKRRLNLAVALLHDPQILLLDEPTVGVDPQSRNSIFDAIEALLAQGKTILYTTHYMEEVERLCQRAIIVDQGKIIADDSVANLKARGLSGRRVILDLDGPVPERIVLEINDLGGVQNVTSAGCRLELETIQLMETIPALLQQLRTHGMEVRHIETEAASLEHVFLALTGRTIRDS